MKTTNAVKKDTNMMLQESFLELRKHETLDRIRVTDICRQANVSRATFYVYYRDVYEMNDSIENSLLEENLRNFRFRGQIYSDPVKYLFEFNKCLSPIKKQLEVLGYGRELEQRRKVERWIVKLGQKEFSTEEEIFLTIVVAGCVALWYKYGDTKDLKKLEFGSKSLKLVTDMLNEMAPGEDANEEYEPMLSGSPILHLQNFLKAKKAAPEAGFLMHLFSC